MTRTAILIVISCLEFSAAALSVAQQPADYLIVENPSALTIYNRFVQALTTRQKAAFVPFTPFEIISEKKLMSDQITEVMEVRSGNSGYYLLISGDTLQNAAQAGFTETVTRVQAVDDTIRLISAGAELQSPKPKGKTIYLAKGTVLFRVFRKGSRYFVRTENAPQVCGWIRLNNREWQPVVKKEVQNDELPPEVRERIRLRMESVNKTYLQFFSYFNNETARPVAVPHWQYAENGRSITLTLSDAQLAAKLAHSTDNFIREIRGILIGYPFTVEFEPPRIVIRPEGQKE